MDDAAAAAAAAEAARFPDVREVKVVLCGCNGVGKKSFLALQQSKAWQGEEGEGRHSRKRLYGVDVVPLLFLTTRGLIRFNVWVLDGAGGRHAPECYADAECGIIMFDVTARITLTDVPNWHRGFYFTPDGANESIPIVLAGNKVEIKDRKVKARRLEATLREMRTHAPKVAYRDTSVRRDYNCDEVLRWIGREVTGDGRLELLTYPLLDLRSSEYFYRIVRWTGLLHATAAGGRRSSPSSTTTTTTRGEERRRGSGSSVGLTDAEATALAVLGNPDDARYREAWWFTYGRMDAEPDPLLSLRALAEFLSRPPPSEAAG